MRRLDLWKLSLRGIATAPMRSFLTVLGMAIGIGAILAVLTLGDAGKNQVAYEMTRLGIDKVWLTATDGSALRHGDGALLAAALGAEVTEQGYLPATIQAGEQSVAAVAVGCEPTYLALIDARLTGGRMPLPAEWLRGSRCALASAELAEALCLRFDGERPPRLALAGQLFTVVGSVRPQNQLTQPDAPLQLYIPIEAYCELAGGAVQELTLSVPRGGAPAETANTAVAALLMRTGRQAQAITMQLQIDAADSVLDIFVDVLAWVAAICILVGGIGVMNILLVSVRERRREIGVMKAMGATGGQICRLFLAEALVYSGVGGLAGVLAGLAIIALAAAAIGLSPVVRLEDVAAVALASAAVGLGFGVAPALRASRLPPVDALRDP